MFDLNSIYFEFQVKHEAAAAMHQNNQDAKMKSIFGGKIDCEGPSLSVQKGLSESVSKKRGRKKAKQNSTHFKTFFQIPKLKFDSGPSKHGGYFCVAVSQD